MKALLTTLWLAVLLLVSSWSLGYREAHAEERWVTFIQSSHEWAVFLCKNYLITHACGTDKDYADPGELPQVISVGDTIRYTNRHHEQREFVVRHMRFFVFDKDVDVAYAGKRLTARKGDTTCTLYDAKTRAGTQDTEYPSTIVIKGCRVLQ